MTPATWKRFWAKVELGLNCWEWQGALANGYGAMRIGGRKGKTVYARRELYEHFFGPIPEKLQLCHSCDNPKCVRPSHWFLGTASDNMNDCYSKGRNPRPNLAKTHCPRGHPYSGHNLIMSRGCRGCRECKNLARRLKRANNPRVCVPQHGWAE